MENEISDMKTWKTQHEVDKDRRLGVSCLRTHVPMANQKGRRRHRRNRRERPQ